MSNFQFDLVFGRNDVLLTQVRKIDRLQPAGRLAKLRAATADASEERKAELRREMVDLARKALGR